MPTTTKSTTKKPRSARRSRHEGMGAIPYKTGVAFRVWAPNAEAVYVTGSFNDWAHEDNPLAHEADGYWSADVRGAKPGDEYKFVIVNGEQMLHRNDPYAREMTNSVGNGVVHDPSFDWGDDAFQMAPWNELVLYEMHVGTFNDENPHGPGDLYSAASRLDYLVDLGVNAVVLMPLAEFAGDFSWGYNPAHPFAVESSYGGPKALKMFVKTAHERGLAVLLDVVYNHFGPSDLDLWRFDGWGEDPWGGIYFYNDERAETPWGATRPDYGRPEVRRYIRDNVMMWLEDYRLDGLRWDGTVFIRNKSFTCDPSNDIPEGWQLMQEINREVRERFPGRLMIAEDLQRNDWLTRSVDEGGAGFGSQWDAGFVHPVRAALIAPNDEHRDLDAVSAALVGYAGPDATQRVIYTESHDEVANGKQRLPEEIWAGNAVSWASKKRSTLGGSMVFTSPGIPMLFQGQELLAHGWFQDTVPLDWKSLEERRGIVMLYQSLIALRRNLAGVTRGLTGQHVDLYHRDVNNRLLAYHRWEHGGPGDSTVVIVNLTGGEIMDYWLAFPQAGFWRVRFNSDWEGYGQGHGDDFGNHPTLDVEAVPGDGGKPGAIVSVGPYSAVIYSQDPG